MARDTKQPRLAVLIDADNASAKIVDGLFEEIAKLGEASVRRIYGDFSSPRSRAWADVLTRYAIDPRHQPANTVGKNASDITLVIDAMDLLLSHRFDGFCLVSSDSDFTRLASRIREEGVDAYGFGEQKTPESFRRACGRFILTENLLAQPAAAGDEATTKALESLSHANHLVQPVVSELESDGGWVGLGELGKQIYNRTPDFDPRTYGFKKLSDLVRKLGTLEVTETEGGQLRVRVKPAEPKRRGRKA